MANGFVGKILDVDLSMGRMGDEALDETLCRRFLGGHGLGAKLLYDRMKANVDPLGLESLLGFFTGPLTGTPAIEGNRFAVVCKSPLTETWGDANCGGTFGPHLKFAGYDGILVRGVASHGVYLSIKDGVPELRDGVDLWGRDTNETEDLLRRELGACEIASIGQAGERLSRDRGDHQRQGACRGTRRRRCRDGIQALEGHRGLGPRERALSNAARVRALRTRYLKRHGGAYDLFVKYGTIGITGSSAMNGDSPVKKLGRRGARGLPERRHQVPRRHRDRTCARRQRRRGLPVRPFLLRLAVHPGLPHRRDWMDDRYGRVRSDRRAHRQHSSRLQPARGPESHPFRDSGPRDRQAASHRREPPRDHRGRRHAGPRLLSGMAWDPETARPNRDRLLALGLEEVARDLY
jgi:hypothetical protein